MIENNIPVIVVSGKTIPEVWEKSLIETWEKGCIIKTQYDKPEDPPSRDVTMIMVIEEPLSEPRIHKNFPAGLENLEIYRQEVIEGVHDYWINPDEGKWTYTYHQRLFNYKIFENKDTINQIDYIINTLSQSPYSRRAQGITWIPHIDTLTNDPPCLQRIWCRLSQDSNNNYFLNMNTHWRSRDAYKAAFMNIFALTDLQKTISEQLSRKINKEIKIGRYVDISDSYHIYGSYFNEFKKFLESFKQRPFESRVWNTYDEIVQIAFEEGKKILEKEKLTGDKGKII